MNRYGNLYPDSAEVYHVSAQLSARLSSGGEVGRQLRTISIVATGPTDAVRRIWDLLAVYAELTTLVDRRLTAGVVRNSDLAYWSVSTDQSQRYECQPVYRNRR